MEYKVIYSNRRTISLSIKDEKLIVRAPYGTLKGRIDSVVLEHSAWIMKHINKQKQRNETLGELTEDRIKALRRAAKKILPIKVEYYSRIMGLKYGRITITSAKTRFGSCSSKGNLSFSYLLMLYPDSAIDYVVVHELAHLREMNHSPRFYKIIEEVLPDYKERKKLLKK